MGQATPLPGPLRLLPAYGFAGRERELAQLRALLPRTVGEGRRAALVAGEPGSGKSRLVRELAGELADEGAIVLYGDCDAVVGSPYAPFATALVELARGGGMGPAVLDGLGASKADLARLVPELAAGPLARAGGSSDADAERLRLHTAVTELLVAVSDEAPVLLVLEDLHWADASTLLLVRHLVRSGAAARMLVVATFRDTEADVAAELSEALVDVYRTEGVVRIRLGGLADAELAEFIRLAAGAEPTEELTGVVRDLTGGNAFLVTELWRELVDEGAVAIGPSAARLVRPASELGTPATVREVANQRLQRLSAPPSSCSSSPRSPAPTSSSRPSATPTCWRRRPSWMRSTRPSTPGCSSSVREPGSRTGSRTSSSGGRSSGACPPPGPPSSTFVSRGRSSTAGCDPTGQPSSPRSPITTRPLRRSATSNAPSR